MTRTIRAIKGNEVLSTKHYEYVNDYSEREIAKRVYAGLPGQDAPSAIIVVFDNCDRLIRRIY